MFSFFQVYHKIQRIKQYLIVICVGSQYWESDRPVVLRVGIHTIEFHCATVFKRPANIMLTLRRTKLRTKSPTTQAIFVLNNRVRHEVTNEAYLVYTYISIT